MLKIRLQRIGRKNDPSFRVVLTDSKNATKSGKFLEVVGTYNPKSGETLFNIYRIKDLLSKGAQLSPTVHNALVHQKLIPGKKINVLPKKTVPKKEEVKEEVKAEVKAEEPKAEAKEETPAEEAKVEENAA